MIEEMVDVDRIQSNKYSEEEYEVWDELLQKWVAPSKSCYHHKHKSGFPGPKEAVHPITLIQIYDNKEDVIIVLGLKDWNYREHYEYEKKYIYKKLDSEVELIEKRMERYR